MKLNQVAIPDIPERSERVNKIQDAVIIALIIFIAISIYKMQPSNIVRAISKKTIKDGKCQLII